MKGDSECRNSGSSDRSPKESSVRRLLVPSAKNPHCAARIVTGAAANVALAIWVLPGLGKMFDPIHTFTNALQALLEVTVPCAALLVLLPVILFGRDVPRLLAIGLSFLPAYVGIAGLEGAWSLWLAGR